MAISTETGVIATGKLPVADQPGTARGRIGTQRTVASHATAGGRPAIDEEGTRSSTPKGSAVETALLTNITSSRKNRGVKIRKIRDIKRVI